jgi:hypothetical protein
MLNTFSIAGGPFRRATMRHLGRTILCAVTLFGLSASMAHAVPSYARQTGADCASCHVGSFGPQLTPYGIKFKLGGYTDTDGKDGKIPLSAMIEGGMSKNAQAPADGSASATNTTVQQVSIFLGGRFAENVGAFIQTTSAGFTTQFSLDELDIRYARSLKLGDKEAIVGLSLNNTPTTTDPFNTLAQWRFPYITSDSNQNLAGYNPGGSTPKVEDLAGGVLGLNAYAFYDNNFYGELGLYTTPSLSDLKTVNAGDIGAFKGPGTYARFAYFKDMKRENFSVGVFGFNVDLQPDRTNLGVADNFRDLGVDGSYQFLGNREHIFTLNASYVKEWQKLNYTNSLADGASANLKNTVNQFRLAGSYTYAQTWGLSAGVFDTRGSADSGLYSNSSNGLPNTTGYVLQADWTPWGKENSMGAPFANVRIGVQYTGYTKYLGSSTYSVADANGNTVYRNAKDNNTLMLFLWTAI